MATERPLPSRHSYDDLEVRNGSRGKATQVFGTSPPLLRRKPRGREDQPPLGPLSIVPPTSRSTTEITQGKGPLSGGDTTYTALKAVGKSHSSLRDFAFRGSMTQPAGEGTVEDMQMPMEMAKMQERSFYARIDLPKKLTMVVRCNIFMTLLEMIEKAVYHAKDFLGVVFDTSDIRSIRVFAGAHDIWEELFALEVAGNIQYVRDCIKNGSRPALAADLPLCPPSRPQTYVSHCTLDEPPSPVAEAQDNVNLEENRAGTFRSLRRSFYKPRTTSNASQAQKPDVSGLASIYSNEDRRLSLSAIVKEVPMPVITVAELITNLNSRPLSRVAVPSIMAEADLLGDTAAATDLCHPRTASYDITFAFLADIKAKSAVDLTETDTEIKMQVKGRSTVREVKAMLYAHRSMPLLNQPWDQYCLRFTNERKQEIMLVDDDQTMQTVSHVKRCLKDEIPIVFTLVLRNAPLSKQAQRINKSIGALIGFGLYRLDHVDVEVDYVRRRFVNARRQAVESRDPKLYGMEPDIELWFGESDKAKLLSAKIPMRVHLKSVVKTVTCEPTSTPSQIVESLLRKKAISVENRAPENYVLKVPGVDEFLTGEYQMTNYSYIRRCLLQGEWINLMLVPRQEVTDNRTVDDYGLIEELPGLGTHAQLTIQGQKPEDVKWISLWDVTRNYRLFVGECERIAIGDRAFEAIYVEAGMYYGGNLLCPIVTTQQVKCSSNPKLLTWLVFDIAICNIPKGARICFTVYGKYNAKKRTIADKESDVSPIGWVNLLLINYKGYLKIGPGALHLKLWPNEKANPIGTCVSSEDPEYAALLLHLEQFEKPIVHPTEQYYSEEYKVKCEKAPPPKDDQHVQTLEWIINSDPLTKINDDHAALLWRYRYYCTRRAEALPKMLLATKWSSLDDVTEMQKLLAVWAPMPPEAALELLDANFPDEAVRSLAVSRLEMLSDEAVLDYLLQLIQVLKYEPFHDSALSRFLLKRALRNRIVGHHFFWFLRSEMSQPEVSLRFGLLLEAYLRGAETHMEELIQQHDAMSALLNVASQIKCAKPADRQGGLLELLSKITLPRQLVTPLNPRIKIKGVITDRCRVMDSKKLPIRLVFENDDPFGAPVHIIFKTGDDLRQDMLTLQMIKIMDKLWQNEGLDLRMLPYNCISTGQDVGMIQVVLNAETVSNIQRSYGGSTAAFKDQPIDEYIRKHNTVEADYLKALETFTLSCAGYCVATYVLGIGDRHNDNIMVTKSGHLFHIDFGHFLGNIKRKFGIKRERAPFVLTPDFVYVMGKKDGEQFKKFVEYCIQAYLILRRKGNMFISLFAMMLSTGIPELKSSEDIQYLRDALCIGMTEEAAANEFRNLIFESLRLGWSTQLNWWLHNLAHR